MDKKERFQLAKKNVLKRFPKAVTLADSRGKFYVAQDGIDICNKEMHKAVKRGAGLEELNLIKIFILPPDKKELKKRLVKRNQDNDQIVKKRLKQYENDVQHWFDYDYVVINNDLESCFSQIEKIIESHKKRINFSFN